MTVGPVKMVPNPSGFPGHTVWGRTTGPCAFLGMVEHGNGVDPGIGVYVDEREMRQLTRCFGWPSPEEHADLQQRHVDLAAEHARVLAELEVARENVVQVVPVRQLAGVIAQSQRGDHGAH